MAITTINPATGKSLATYACLTEPEINSIINQTQNAYTDWSQTTLSERAKCFNKLADILLNDKEKFSHLITTEMGKTLKSASDEIEKCARTCRFFPEQAETYLAPRIIKTEMKKSYVTYRPLGIIFAIMPWNFPFWQVFRFAAPALMAGNCALLKHAPITTGCGLAIAKIFAQAGFPKNVFNTVVIENDLAEKTIRHPAIAAVTLTGSHQTGKTVAAIAGSALKKIVLELGSNDPYIILADADLPLAVDAILASRMNNAGQSCIAAKRILAVQAIRQAFQTQLLTQLAQYHYGDPTDPTIQLGPLAREDLRDHLAQQVQTSVNQGAKILLGGTVPDQAGFYYPPTVLVNVSKGMPAYEEELFGPVLTLIDVKDEQEAITIANASKFGLSAAIFTQDVAHGEHLAVNELHAGTVFVNDFVRSDARLPFGGIKGSGYGRELSLEGMHEFVNIKTIAVK